MGEGTRVTRSHLSVRGARVESVKIVWGWGVPTHYLDSALMP